jgi:hypothetical protein
MEKRPAREEVSRRGVLRAGTFAVGGVVLGGVGLRGVWTETGADPDQRGGALVSAVERHGHYSWFPHGPDSWGRSTAPFDGGDGESRWVAQPTDGGAIRCRVENLPAERNAGFDVHLGALGDVAEVTVVSQTVETQRTTGPATMFVGLFLDVDGDGEFFLWEDADGPTDGWVGLGDDEEGVLSSASGGELTLDADTEFFVVGTEQTATLADLKRGDVEGVDGATAAALYVGVASSGEGTEEIVVEAVDVRRN